MEDNPDQTHSSRKPESQTADPHTTSIRREAWRGFKLGFIVAGIIMSAILSIIVWGMLVAAMNRVVVTKGEALNGINYFQLATDICGGMFGVLLAALYGGITGSVVMTLAALIRKCRSNTADSKLA